MSENLVKRPSEKHTYGRTFRRKCVIVGDGGIGKTCVYVAYAKQDFIESHVPTVFETYITDIHLEEENTNVILSLWDTAGQEDYDRLRPLSYPETNVALLGFSIKSPDSYTNGKEKWAQELCHFCKDSIKIVLALKVDLREDIDTINELAKNNIKLITKQETICLQTDIKFDASHECSAKTRVGIDELFQMVARMSLTTLKKKKSKCSIL
ncbi:hypothetical protein A3Q56_02345 [Intoshia linei]|uniref:Uncharacterized protein n=1 Tax=Intoshia linei TaxID=1819745 RepID=A0A177B6P1_9BILA|nr:hypothetical protein A3Q56_02345 [Intoshia linei]